MAGRTGLTLFSVYASSKFALEGLTESMVYELQSFGIRVVIVEPGNIKTTFRSEKAAKVTKNSPYYTMLLNLPLVLGQEKYLNNWNRHVCCKDHI
ncbi:MAG: SDR family NAD(P)-dependent oxidoreductase [Nitrososphaeraceae archaeon]